MYPQALGLIGEDPAAPLALVFRRSFRSLAAAQKAGASRLREFYRRRNVRSAERVEERVAVVAQARAITADEAILRPAALELPRLLDLLEVLARHIAAYDQAISKAFAAHPKAEIFAALPGAGPVLAPRLLTLFGERAERYPDAASLQKYAGVAPVRERSQGRLWVHWRWAAPKFLRQSLVEWAGADRAALRVGEGVLSQAESRGQRPPRHPPLPRLQMGAHPLAVLEGQRAL